ncbi:MAG: hypothetical protein ACHQX1_00435 [Candidatus Micrarchaeales archaeon]
MPNTAMWKSMPRRCIYCGNETRPNEATTTCNGCLEKIRLGNLKRGIA